MIVTNGEETEKKYYHGLSKEPWVKASRVVVIFHNGAPAAAVDRSIIEAPGYTGTWVVCDVDEFNVETAIASTRKSDVVLTLSSPCFEVWLILHLFDGCGPFDNASQAGTRLKKLLPSWDKANFNFNDFRVGVLEAEGRARGLAGHIRRAT